MRPNSQETTDLVLLTEEILMENFNNQENQISSLLTLILS